MEYNIGDIFRLDEDYSNKAQWCNENGLMIMEIEPKNGERRFQIQEVPPPTEEEILEGLRNRREVECFSIINRGQLWYDKLTLSQREELDKWYKEWLDITDKYQEGIDIETIIPKKPKWLN